MYAEFLIISNRTVIIPFLEKIEMAFIRKLVLGTISIKIHPMYFDLVV